MMIKSGVASLFLVLLALAISFAGCDSVERIYDCNSICNKYRDCADSDYDVAECTSRCEDRASDSESFEDRADECQECVDDRSCVSAAFGCAGECVGIVP